MELCYVVLTPNNTTVVIWIIENNMYVLMSLYLASYQLPVEYRKAQL